VGAAALLVAGLMLGVIATTFDELHIRLDAGGLRFGFGPFRRTLTAAQLHAAYVEPYSWLRFGGWGLRWSFTRGLREQAYSVPLLRVGVAVETNDGHRFHVSTRRPAEFAAAINAFASGLPAGWPR
jgi:hypothetical protein